MLANGAASTALTGFTNDLWEFTSDSCTAVAPPSASFQSSATLLCNNGCVNFTNQSTNSTSWFWYFDGGTPDTSTAESPQNICYSMPGSYSVTLVASNGAAVDSITFGDYISILPLPQPPYIHISQFTDTLYFDPGLSFASCQWYLDSVAIQGATSPSIYISQSGIYTVEVTNEYGCKIAASLNVTAGVQNYFMDATISLYPDPASNQLTIHTSSLKNEGVMVEVVDMLGRMTSPPATLFQEKGDAVIDVSQLAAGMYFVELKSGSSSVVKKFVKE